MRNGVGECLDQQFAQIQHLNSATAERLGEACVLLLRTVDPGQPIEEQGIVVAWRQPPQLVAGRCSSTVRNRPTSERTPGTVTASTDMTVRLPITRTPQARRVAGLALAG